MSIEVMVSEWGVTSVRNDGAYMMNVSELPMSVADLLSKDSAA